MIFSENIFGTLEKWSLMGGVSTGRLGLGLGLAFRVRFDCSNTSQVSETL